MKEDEKITYHWQGFPMTSVIQVWPRRGSFAYFKYIIVLKKDEERRLKFLAKLSGHNPFHQKKVQKSPDWGKNNPGPNKFG